MPKDDEKGQDTTVAVEAAAHEKRQYYLLKLLDSGSHIRRWPPVYTSEVDVAVNERLTWKTAMLILTNHLTWLPALAYITTFGFELAVDASLANVIYGIYKSPTFGQTKAGYVSSQSSPPILILTCAKAHVSVRPFELVDPTHRYVVSLCCVMIWAGTDRSIGGFIGDLAYKKYGVSSCDSTRSHTAQQVPGKKYNMLACGFFQGAMAIAFGLYIDHNLKNGEKPSR